MDIITRSCRAGRAVRRAAGLVGLRGLLGPGRPVVPREALESEERLESFTFIASSEGLRPLSKDCRPHVVFCHEHVWLPPKCALSVRQASHHHGPALVPVCPPFFRRSEIVGSVSSCASALLGGLAFRLCRGVRHLARFDCSLSPLCSVRHRLSTCNTASASAALTRVEFDQ